MLAAFFFFAMERAGDGGVFLTAAKYRFIIRSYIKFIEQVKAILLINFTADNFTRTTKIDLGS